ncbi:hypothetical protein CDEF62S_02670 [Castellaniella defragrans]
MSGGKTSTQQVWPRRAAGLLLCLCCTSPAWADPPSSLGLSGLINMPSGTMDPDGTWWMGVSHAQPYTGFYSTLQFLPDLQVSGRYTRISGVAGFTDPNTSYGDYKDKAAGFKLRVLREGAFGLDWLPDVSDRAWTSYVGGCKDGLAQGEGLAKGPHGAWYRGGFKAGMKSGHGVKLYPNGDGYAGDWRQDRRDGEGRYEYGDRSPWRGDVYQGGWKADQMEGRGTYIFYPSGDRFVAQWHEGHTDTVGTATITRRKRAYEVLAPVLSKPGLVVCSVTTDGAGPDHIARGVVVGSLGDRLRVRLTSPDVLARSAEPGLNPRWEVMTDWLPCP